MFLFVESTGNRKTGPIPVTYSSKSTCPDSCSLKAGGCYAAGGPTAMAWRRADTGIDLDALIAKIKALPAGQIWRMNVAGDLPGNGKTVDKRSLTKLVKAAAHTKGYTYTHYDDKASLAAVAKANAAGGLVINLSADDPADADALLATGAGPVVTVLPQDVSAAPTHTPGGTRIVVCPTYTHDNVTCESCQLCAVGTRKAVVGFPAHGFQAKKAEARSIAIVRKPALV